MAVFYGRGESMEARRPRRMNFTMPSSLAYAATVETVLVGKNAPDTVKSLRYVRMGALGGRGLVLEGTSIAVGEPTYTPNPVGVGTVGEPRIVAEIDRETRVGKGDWIISWVGAPSAEDGDPEANLTLDPEMFGPVLLAWVYQRADGQQTVVDLSEFVGGDITLASVMPLAESLVSADLLSLTAREGLGFVALTNGGVAAAEEDAAARAHPVRRAEALQRGMILWLYDRHNTRPVMWEDFPFDAKAVFRGHFFGLREIATEVEY